MASLASGGFVLTNGCLCLLILVSLHWWQRWDMATAIYGLALPEISVENFEHSWTRFEFTAAANKWDNGRDLVILPALLRGKLQDFYTTLNDDEKKDLATLKRALSDRAGLTKDPLASAKKFTEKKQDAKESVRYFEADLRKLFTEAYPGEDANESSVLLGRFVTGLLPEITRQMLLRGSPTTMEGAVKSAIEIERALGFQTVETQQVQALRAEETPVKGHGQKSELELQEKLDQVLRRMESLELRFGSGRRATANYRCYNCNREGHIRRHCPFASASQVQGRGQRRTGNDTEIDESVRGDGEWNKAQVCGCNLSYTTMCARGLLGGRSVHFLIDSGAAVSVVSHDILSTSARADINKAAPLTVGANGLPLDMLGSVNLQVNVNNVCTSHVFIVAGKLTVDCLLGIDFLSCHGAVLDCARNTLSFASKPDHGSAGVVKPMHEGIFKVSIAETIQIPARSGMLVKGRVEHSSLLTGKEGLVEPNHMNSSGLLIARSLDTVGGSNEVNVQITNITPKEVTLYQGMRVADFSLGQCIMSVDKHSCESHSTEMPKVDLTGADLTHSQMRDLKKLIGEFRRPFVTEGGPTGRTSKVKHTIVTNGPPVREPLRRIPHMLQDTVKAEVEKMLQHGVIRESSSPCSSPIVTIKKKDGSWRFCVDFRKVNSMTRRDAYPLPRIDETLEALAGSQFFTTLDLASGYWQVEMEEADRAKTAFSTRDGHFEFNVMPFGLTNAPATFQRLMECVLAGLTYEQCLIYFDDIVVFSVTFDQHLERLRAVQHLDNAGLKMKPNKCHFAKGEIRYLGHVVSRQGIQADPEKNQCHDFISSSK